MQMMSEDLTDEEKKALAMSYEDRLRDYNRLKSKYEAAERNLKNHAEKCGGEDSIKGHMSGLIEGMVLLNPNLLSTTGWDLDKSLSNELYFIKEILFYQKDIENRISEIRNKIFEHYKDIKKTIWVFSVLKGGKYFSDILFPKDLVIDRKFKVGYISASSYFNNKKLPNDQIKLDLMGHGTKALWVAQILIIDDIYDTVVTIRQLHG